MFLYLQRIPQENSTDYHKKYEVMGDTQTLHQLTESSSRLLRQRAEKKTKRYE